MNQTLRVQWCQTLTSSFKVCTGVKQGGVLSPILFAVQWLQEKSSHGKNGRKIYMF